MNFEKRFDGDVHDYGDCVEFMTYDFDMIDSAAIKVIDKLMDSSIHYTYLSFGLTSKRYSNEFELTPG